ncbi:Uncharacterized protein TCM_047111, partial [Theobroma cacao]
MLRLRSLSLRVVHRQTAASSSTSPERTGQHSFTTGSPITMCTNPPRRSTQAPSFSVSIGQVAVAGGGGQDFPLGGVVIGGTVTGGRLMGGFTIGGINGGRLIGGFTTGGSVTGGTVTGGFTIGGTVTGGKLIGGLTMGGMVMGPLGDFPLGFLCFGGGLPQVPQPRIGVAAEMKSMQMRSRAEILVLSILIVEWSGVEWNGMS